MDRFEVTVGRFQQYVWAYDTIDPPNDGDGAHPAFPSSGWQRSWTADADRYPGSQFALESVLHQNRADVSVDADLQLPIRGVSWYTALAFCVWDGARLPTESEWTYAASGGAQTRAYPWQDDLAPPIDHKLAQYSDAVESHDAPARVGEHDMGRAAFGHQDLAGNLEEWVADMYQARLPEQCEDELAPGAETTECLQLAGSELRVTRGGSYRDGGDRLRNTSRSRELAVRARSYIGFRCARDIPE